MRGLMVAVVGMGVLIVAGVTVLVTLLMQRMSPAAAPIASAPAASAMPVLPGGVTLPLDEPAGTRIVGLSMSGDRVALQLSGGGADRVVVVDVRGRVLGRVTVGSQ